MRHETEPFARILKAARESKGLSQRALSGKAGVPQAHISNIERGAVDLRLSSLIALARALDLELTLVPRKAVPAVQSIIRSSDSAAAPPAEMLKELQRLQETVKSLQSAAQIPEIAQLARQLRELQSFRLSAPQIETLKEARKAVQAFAEHTRGLEDLRQTVSRLQRLRNELAHGVASAPRIDPVKPAYSLDDEEGDDA